MLFFSDYSTVEHLLNYCTECSMADSIPLCERETIHQESVDAVRKTLLEQGDTIESDLATFFKLFGDRTRIRLLRALLVRELCVCDLASVLGVTKSAVSHHLKALRCMNIVRFRREGQIVYYSLADSHVERILALGLEHCSE